MKKTILIILGLIVFALICRMFIPTDIRNDHLRKAESNADQSKMEELLHQMEEAYGGRAAWDTMGYFTYVQRADWYGRSGPAGWDTLPQRFMMKSFINTTEGEIELLNGPNTGTKYKLANNQFYKQEAGGTWEEHEPNRIEKKIDFKNYWFQFPFRMREAAIKKYAGTEVVNGIEYELLFVSWGSEAANRDYDQYLLYLHPESHLIDYLIFTLRDIQVALQVISRWDDFRQVGPFTLPHSQYITFGKPGKAFAKMHENHYEKIELPN